MSLIDKIRNKNNDRDAGFIRGSRAFVKSPKEPKDSNFVTEIIDIPHARYQMKILNTLDKFLSNKDFRFVGTKKVLVPIGSDNYQNIIKKLSKLGKVYQLYGASIIVLNNDYLLNIELTINNDSTMSLNITINTSDVNKMMHVEKLIDETFERYEGSISINIGAFFLDSRRRLIDYEMEIELSEVVHSEAYPFISNGKINEYIERFINSNENVLILIGPAGTGKTVFIRNILRKIVESYRAPHSVEEYFTAKRRSVMYTNSSDALNSDELFLNFLQNKNCMMVLEDVDFFLGSRKNGDNPLMYKLLGNSDGLIPTNNKIIISTNADSVSKIDDALLRPGRCFDVAKFRYLDLEEANLLLEKLNFENEKLKESRHYSLSEIYRFYNNGYLDNQNPSKRKVGLI